MCLGGVVWREGGEVWRGGEGFRVYEIPSPCFRVFKMDEKYLGDFLKPPKLSLDYFFSSPNWEVTITTQGDGASLPFPSLPPKPSPPMSSKLPKTP